MRIHHFTIPVIRVTIIRSPYKTDRIRFVADENHSNMIHPGEYRNLFGNVSYEIEVTQGRGEEVCKALGIPDDIVQVVETVPKWSHE